MRELSQETLDRIEADKQYEFEEEARLEASRIQRERDSEWNEHGFYDEKAFWTWKEGR